MQTSLFAPKPASYLAQRADLGNAARCGRATIPRAVTYPHTRRLANIPPADCNLALAQARPRAVSPRRVARAEPPLNAIAPCPPEADEDRTARHLRTCRRLAELGMQLAEGAAAHALREFDAPPECPIPGTKPRHLTGGARLFTRLSYAVRQAMALEARIASGTLVESATQPRAMPPRPAGAPGAGPPNRPKPSGKLTLDRERIERLDCDPARDATIPEALAAICRGLGLAPAPSAGPPRAQRRPPEPPLPARLQPPEPAPRRQHRAVAAAPLIPAAARSPP